MLVLTRRPGQGFTITTEQGKTLRVVVLPPRHGKGGEARLGIVGLKNEFLVSRDELLNNYRLPPDAAGEGPDPVREAGEGRGADRGVPDTRT